VKFIDLFAGIGGFHIALEKLGHECVFASELSVELRKLYKENYGMDCFGDITKISPKEIPTHDILCAGFPCQSFSKAGNQMGMQEARGKLFDNIVNILEIHKPKYILLENVRNLLTHDKGFTWKYISEKLINLGYSIDKKILSPHYFNIPQHRERIFIVGCLDNNIIEKMKWPKKQEYISSVCDILDSNNKQNLEKEKIYSLGVWQEFLDVLPPNIDPYSPLWTMEFGATYPIDKNWSEIKLEEWKNYKGSYGFPLNLCLSLEEVYCHLPNYVKTQKGIPPHWKQKHLISNRLFYIRNSVFIKDELLTKIIELKSESYRKFEWNCKGEIKNFNSKLIQFRGSGIRVKRGDYLPSLVTVSTQIPIIGNDLRYITPREGARVQSLPEDIKLPNNKTASFRILGNMVNVNIVYKIAKVLLME
jgi:DNA (cytosine-5)-methyltransferase 1